MRIEGERTKRTRLVQAGRYVIAVEVELVYPVDDPSEACYEPEVVELLRQIEAHAIAGDVAWLKQRGVVYERLSAA